MYGSISTLAFAGIEARAVEVQVSVSPGLPAFAIVGLADKAVAESRERVRAALHSVGLGLPPKHITVNLAPADLPKEGSHYDLAIALALMVACGAVSQDAVDGFVVVGELALDGAIAHVVGALPAAMGAVAQEKGLICPAACGAEAAWASQEMALLAPAHLLSLVNHFSGTQPLSRPEPEIGESVSDSVDMRDVRGQESAKRALEIAAAGGHNILMVGPPGSGKSMIARRLPTILPDLTPTEMLEVSQIRSLAGELADGRLSRSRPFRAPHHSASMAALVGGGAHPRPGEVALAHNGVLFLDELPEFSPQVLDSLRQPLEAGESVIARANHRICYPARFQLVAAMNPCRCGHAGEPGFACRLGNNCAARYQSRISGPLLDRIDIRVEVPAVSAADLTLPPAKEQSGDIRERVAAARERQIARFGGKARGGASLNANCSPSQLDETFNLSDSAQSLIAETADMVRLSARGFHRVLRVARTIGDLDGSEAIERHHLAESIGLRSTAAVSDRAAMMVPV